MARACVLTTSATIPVRGRRVECVSVYGLEPDSKVSTPSPKQYGNLMRGSERNWGQRAHPTYSSVAENFICLGVDHSSAVYHL